ncbi:MAG: hypothetical protein HY921_10665 [Elusimicrobia bacterium]|nr:hypothetical protein [Elusimicrobiota bacterium]
MPDKRCRVGIDVGGTFTHAVALSEPEGSLLAQTKVPTTHSAPEGVSLGIVHALRQILKDGGVAPGDVSRVAYSTTQVTNALLEGDVCSVGILAVGRGWEGARTQSETALEPLELCPGRFLKAFHAYADLDKDSGDAALSQAIESLRALGAEALVAVSAFSVDNPDLEKRLLDLAAGLNIPATATHEVSQLYGLKIRTRTAAVNAALLPKMMQTASMTEAAVRALDIKAPIVVMRSDGGAMDISEMKRRPILTLLSGPAAGVAAALMAARIADGLFLEVGGTSTDISCIKNGHPSLKAARVGAHRIFLNTLDVRTVGVAGGSMPRVSGRKVAAVGPRSAHIAGLGYSAFPREGASWTKAATFSPKPGDPADYLALLEGGAKLPSAALTPTCAANALGLLPEGDNARGDAASAAKGCAALAEILGKSPEEAAREIMAAGARPILATLKELIEEYQMDAERVKLVGGGGGAGVWIQYLSRELKLPGGVVEHAPVISAIGAALALLQETVERNLMDPKPEDLAQIRREAEDRLLRSGAIPESIEVRVEADSQRGILRAVAVGSHEMAADEKKLPLEEIAAKAAELMGAADGASLTARTDRYLVYESRILRKSFLGLSRQAKTPWRVLDLNGRARLASSNGTVLKTSAKSLLQDLPSAVERYSNYGDAGQVLPQTFLVLNDRTVDLSGLANLEQMLSVCHQELGRLKAEDPVVLAISFP